MTAHEWTDVTVEVNGVKLPGCSVEWRDVDEPIVPDTAGAGWGNLTIEGFVEYPFADFVALFRKPYRYERLRWRRLLPWSHDAIGRLSIVASRGNDRAFIGRWKAPRTWTARVDRGAFGVVAEFSRRCDAKRWCEVTLAKWSCR